MSGLRRILAVALVAGTVLSGSAALAGGSPQSGSSARFDSGNGETRIRINMTPTAGVAAKARLEYSVRPDRRAFKVQVEARNTLNGTVLTVNVNGQAVGTLTLVGGVGELELSSQDGDAVPTIQKGDVITVTNEAGATLLSATF